MFENHETTFDLSVDPTLTAEEMQAGVETPKVVPLLPAAAPWRRRSIAGCRSPLVRLIIAGRGEDATPRLMFTDTTFSTGAMVYVLEAGDDVEVNAALRRSPAAIDWVGDLRNT
jgi:hypothetical protein